MKFLPLVVVAVVGMVARVNAADSPQGVTREKLEMMANGLDLNSDGYLVKDEMPGMEDHVWLAMLALGSPSSLKDGKFSIDEFLNFTMKQPTGGQGGQGGPSPGGPSNPDLNSDGFITKDEATAIAPPNTVTDDCWNAMVKRADTNNDKKVTAEEFMAMAASSSGEMPEACTDNPGGASSMKAAFSLLSVFALALRLF